MYANGLNYLAILVCSIISFLVGALWYSPFLLGKKWMAALGKTEEELKKRSTPSLYVFTFISWIIIVYVLATIINLAGVINAVGGFYVAVLCWVGFTAATSLIHHMFAGRANSLWIIDSGYILVALIISGIILSVW